MVRLPISDVGQFTSVLILKCALSKFICLEPLRDVSAQSISEALITIFTNHGVPEYIISDNGVEFSNYLTKDVIILQNNFISPLLILDQMVKQKIKSRQLKIHCQC